MKKVWRSFVEEEKELWNDGSINGKIVVILMPVLLPLTCLVTIPIVLIRAEIKYRRYKKGNKQEA